MDRDTIKEAKELEKQIAYCEESPSLCEKYNSNVFKNEYNLGFTIGYLCRDKTFYESLKKLLNDTEKRFQHKLDIL